MLAMRKVQMTYKPSWTFTAIVASVEAIAPDQWGKPSTEHHSIVYEAVARNQT